MALSSLKYLVLLVIIRKLKLRFFRVLCSTSLLNYPGNCPRFLFSTQPSKHQNSALALAFQKPLQTVSLTFSALKLANSRNSLLISMPDFEKVASYFSTSNPAFSQAYVLRIRPLFSPAETSFTALSFALSTTIFFYATCLRRRL